MTPLHDLLNRAIEQARTVRPELSIYELGFTSHVNPNTIVRARKGNCSPATLQAVLLAIEELTGKRFDVALVER